MNKLTKKVAISIITWIFIFLTLGTSTFAWFSINNTASATGLTISVQSNATFLLIGDNAGIATNKNGLTKSCAAKYVSGGDEDKKVYPAFYGDGSSLGSGEYEITTTVGKWYTASNVNMNSSNDSVFNVVEIIDANLSYYMLTYEVYLTFSGDSLDYNDELHILFKRLSGDDSLSIVVAIDTTEGTEYLPLDSTNDEVTTTGNVSIKSTTATKITILAYINGNGENVYTNYYILHGISGEFNLDFRINS